VSLIISPEELDQKLDRAEIIYRKLGHGSDDSPRPRREGSKHGVPTFVRELISAEARAETGTHKEIGDSYGVSETTVKNAEDARIGRHQLRGEEQELSDKADELALSMDKQIEDAAAIALLGTLTRIDLDEVKDEKPTAQSVIARNLSQVLDRFRPKVPIGQTNIQFNVFVPPTRKEEEFGDPIRIIETTVRR
jgi:hypothetical protein